MVYANCANCANSKYAIEGVNCQWEYALFQGGIEGVMYKGILSKGERFYDGLLDLLKRRGCFTQGLLCCRMG